MCEWQKRRMNVQSYHNAIMELVEYIPKDKYTNVHGIPRGGLIIATYISHHLNIPLIVDDNFISENTLIVDDLVDTGESIKSYVDDGYDTAVIFYKPRSIVKPTYYIHETMDWVVFPYELWDEPENRDPPTDKEKIHW